MNNEQGIGKLELICIVFNSVICKLFIGTPEKILYGGSAAWLCSILCGIIFLSVLYILLTLYTPYSQSGLLPSVKTRSKALSVFIGGIAAIVFSFFFIQTLISACTLLKTVKYTNSSISAISVFPVIASAATAFFGRKSVLRVHSLFTIGAGLGILLILALNLRRADIYNLMPILGNGSYNIFITAVSNLSLYSGVMVIFFIPTGKISYSFRKTVMLSAAAAVTLNILFTLIFTLGFCTEYASTINLPLYSLSKSASLGSLSARPDLIYLSAAVISSVLFLSLLLRIVATNIRYCTGRKPKRFAAALLCLLPVLSLCGCSNSSEIETNAYIVAIGIDSDNDEFLYTFQISNPLESGGSIGAEEKAAENSNGGNDEPSGNKTVDNILIRANGFYSAADKLQSVLSKNISLSHMKLAVFSKSVAESRNNIESTGAMSEHCRILMKENEIRPSVYLCLADNASEYLTHVNPTLEKNTVSYYELFFGNSRVPFAPVTQIQSFLNNCADPTTAAVVPIVSENSLCGMGIFNNDILSDTLDSNGAVAYKILCGDLYGACIEEPNGKAVISCKKKPELSIETTEESALTRIKISLDIQNVSGDIDVRKSVSNKVEQLLNRAYSQGLDIIGIKKRLKRRYVTENEWASSNISQIVNNCNFLVDFK